MLKMQHYSSIRISKVKATTKRYLKREAISAKVEKFSSKSRKIFNKKRIIFNKMQNWKNFQQM